MTNPSEILGFIELPPDTQWASMNQPLREFPMGLTNVYLGQFRVAQVVKFMIGTTLRREIRCFTEVGFNTITFDTDARGLEIIREYCRPASNLQIRFVAMKAPIPGVKP